MASYCKVIMVGNLTRDPELRVTPKGTSICQFALAVNRRFKGADGSMVEKTAFIDCEAWTGAAETIAKYCTKGKALLIDGRLEQDTWEDKTTGQKRSKLKVVVETFQFLGGGGGRGDGGDGEEHSTEQATPRHARQPTPPRPPANDLDEDVPF